MKTFLLLCSFFILVPCTACGQDMLTATISNIAIHDFQRERIRSEYEQEKIRLGKSGAGSPARSGPAAGDRLSAFRYVPSETTSVKVKQAIIAHLKKVNPVSGKNLEAALNRDNPYAAYVRYLKTRGLDVQHNYADAFTAYLLGMWRIANGWSDDPGAAQISYVRNQVATVMNVSRWNNTQKQEAAAYLVYDLIFANEPYEGSRRSGDKQQQQKDSDAVHDRFLKQNNMNLRKMIITGSGLIPVK
ncbi:hypothetical protein [Niabella beijingensis]|uniref:hypothetical protein n=1 Tax=Niabella beijingensis TaxID=2872700 RepID=UPI001CBABEBA|nr:hypothetical protein [Niabella beijingensis]MBZ4188355.1 hypothetical protein [Niabella beijingensis]